MNVLLIDGVKYHLWTPNKEEEEFHPLIKEHAKEIFGNNSIYLPFEKFLISEAGRGVMPDGFAIILSDSPKLYIVEVELSSHDLDKHIIDQVNRFFRAIKNPENRKRLADDLERKIKEDLLVEAFVRKKIGSKELYRFLSDLVSQVPEVVIIIEEKNEKLIEAFGNFTMAPIIKEFKTYLRENAPGVHAHLFEPLCNSEFELDNINGSSRNNHKITSINQSNSAYTREGYTGKKISSFVLFNQRYKVNHWKQLLLTIVNELAKIHPTNFNKILSLRGKKRPFFTKNPNELREPQKIEGTDIFVETNLSSNAIVRLTNATMSLFGHNEGIKIEVE